MNDSKSKLVVFAVARLEILGILCGWLKRTDVKVNQAEGTLCRKPWT